MYVRANHKLHLCMQMLVGEGAGLTLAGIPWPRAKWSVRLRQQQRDAGTSRHLALTQAQSDGIDYPFAVASINITQHLARPANSAAFGAFRSRLPDAFPSAGICSLSRMAWAAPSAEKTFRLMFSSITHATRESVAPVMTGR